MSCTTMLYFILLIALSSAQFLPTPIYEHADGGVAIATGAVGGPSACRARLFLLRDSTTAGARCLATLNVTGPSADGDVCAAALAGATALSCLGSACYVLNPSTNMVVVVSNYSVTTPFSIAPVTNPNPTAFSAYQRSPTVAELYVVNSDNSVYQFTVSYLNPTTVTPKLLTGLTLPSPAGLFMGDANTLLYASKAATQISRYTVATSAPAAVWSPTFGNIQLLSSDTYGNVHVYDSVGSVIRIVPYATGIVRSTITGIPANPRYIAENRNKVFVIDNTGVTKYEEEFQMTTSTTPAKCMSVGGTISATISGGDYPMIVSAHPDYVNQQASGPGTYTLAMTGAPPPAPASLTLLDDAPNRQLYLTGTAPIAGRAWVNSSVVPPHTGELSYQFTLTGSDDMLLRCATGCITSSFFEWFEIWVNIGAGGQNFTISFEGAGTKDVDMTKIPLHTWYQFKFHIPTMAARRGQLGPRQNVFNGMRITDRSGKAVQNPIYIDTASFILYEQPLPTRYLYVFDACFNYERTPIVLVNQTFTVNIDSTPTSCAANQFPSNPTVDGTLIATTTNGVGPFSFNWSYSTQNAQEISGFPEFSTYITVYDNSLNSSWKDISQAAEYTLSDTTNYHSAPSSISWTPSAEGEGILFQVAPEVNMADYRTIEFWANGGDGGGQTIDIVLFRSTAVNPSWTSGIALASSGYVEVPANQWIRASFSIPNSATVPKWNVISLLSRTPPAQANGFPIPIRQNKIYIDDMVLLGTKSVLTVTDMGTGCQFSAQRARVYSPPPLTQSVAVSNARCYGSSDGTVSVTMGGGTPPYTFTWSRSDGDNDAILTGLGENNVTVTAYDDNMCQFKQYAATVLRPPAIQVNYTVTLPMCHGMKGLVSASAYGGSGAYNYNWVAANHSIRVIPEPAPDAIFLDSLAPGFFLRSMATNCLGTGSLFGLTYSPSHGGYCSLQAQFDSSTSEVGLGGCTLCLSTVKYASIMFWIFADSSSALQSLSVALTKGTARGSATQLSSLAPLSPNAWNKVSFNLGQVNGTNPDGFVLISSSPAAMGTVLIDDVVVVPLAANGVGYSAYPGFRSTIEVVAAKHTLNLVDGNGCTFSAEIELPQPAAVHVKSTVTNASKQTADGAINLDVSGGTPPYTFWWVELNQTTQNVTGLAYGQYTLRVTDSHGCPIDLSVFVDYAQAPAQIRKYNATLASGLAALVSAGLLISLFSLVMLFRYWAQFSTLGSFLSSMMVIGCLTSFLSALVLLPEPTDALCTAFPWLLGVGFVLVYGCLFIKTWALYQVWRKAVHYQRAALTPGYIMRCLGLALLVEVVFLIIWTLVDPPKAQLVSVVNNSRERQCNSDNVTFWVIFLAGKGIWLIFGAVLSILTRNIAKEYNESSSIAYAIYNNILLGAIAIPLAILIKDVPGGRLLVQVVIISIAFSFTMVVVFFKIWHIILLPDKINISKMEGGSKRSKGSKNSSGSGSSGGATRTTAMSKEDSQASMTHSSS